MSAHSSNSSSSHSQDEDGRTPDVRIRGINEYVTRPTPAPAPPVISQFGGAFVLPSNPLPSTTSRKRELESSSQFQTSNYTPDEKRPRTRHSPSLPPNGYSRSRENSRSSTPADAGNDSEDITNEPKEIKDQRKLEEDREKERKELEERHQNERMAAIIASTQKIIYLKSKLSKRDDKINNLEDEVEDLKEDLEKADAKLKDKEDEHWALNAVFESTNEEAEKLKKNNKKLEDDIKKLEMIKLQLEAENSKHMEKFENIKKQKDEAKKKLTESENDLEILKKHVENLKQDLRKETAEFDKTKGELVQSQKKGDELSDNLERYKQEANGTNEKLTKLEKELSQITKSDIESKKDLVKVAAECTKLVQENTNLKDSLTLQTTENEMLKENVAKLQETNKKLSIKAAEGDRNMNAFAEGFMEKVEEEQSSSKINIAHWVRSTKQRLNIMDTDMRKEEKSATDITTPKCKLSKMATGDDKVMHLMNIIVRSLDENNPENLDVPTRKTIDITTTEETAQITSSTPHHSVDMEPGHRSHPQVGNTIKSSPSANISQRDVSDKTVSSSEKV